MATKDQETKALTFREVHEELEHESMLLKKEHDIEDFSVKSEFLNNIGFSNSKAAKMYTAIIETKDYRESLARRYHGMVKFILPEQLDRVCEKYNLFVRDVEHFAGDIPEKNIKDMQNYYIYAEDIFIPSRGLVNLFVNRNKEHINLPTDVLDSLERSAGTDRSRLNEWVTEMFPQIQAMIRDRLGIGDPNKKYRLSDLAEFSRTVDINCNNAFGKPSLWALERNSSETLSSMGDLKIAAVRDLFSSEAFWKDQSRLGLNTNELKATGQVDLDPIVMIRNSVGYLIITAWGDEANDELISNPKYN